MYVGTIDGHLISYAVEQDIPSGKVKFSSISLDYRGLTAEAATEENLVVIMIFLIVLVNSRDSVVCSTDRRLFPVCL